MYRTLTEIEKIRLFMDKVIVLKYYMLTGMSCILILLFNKYCKIPPTIFIIRIPVYNQDNPTVQCQNKHRV